MSVESMARVLTLSRAKGTAKLVLIGIANHDGDGGAWPSIATLAAYANVSERAVQTAIRQLVDLGELRVHVNAGGVGEARGDRRPNRYEITLGDGVKDSSPREGHGVKFSASRGEESFANGVKQASPEPSINHPEPVSARARASKREATTIPDPFVVTRDMRDWAAVKAPAVNVDRETEAFVLYWREGNGAGRRQKNWTTTWKNWLLKSQTDAERRGWVPRVPNEDRVEPRNVTAERLARELDGTLL